MRGQHVRLVVLLGVISIIGILTVQSYFLLQAWNIKEKQLMQSLSIALKTVAEKLSALNQTTLPSNNPVRQITSNYFVVDVNSDIDANVLEYYLKSEFERLNISIDYEYGIYDCHTDRMVYGDYISATGSGEPQMAEHMPKYHDYLYYFGIRFPGLRSTIAWDMTLLFFFSAILLICLIFFAYAIFVILQQKRFSELQRDFINNMTHEFKIPISTINISADVITQPEIILDPPRLLKYGGIIRQENQRLNLLVEKVLQIARIEKGVIQLKSEKIDLNALLTTIAENFQSNMNNAGKIEVSLAPEVGLIDADVLHLANIFHNLMENSLKYAGQNPQILIETKRNHHQVQIFFTDNGPGIGAKYSKLVFRKFYRIPSGNLHDVKGFGLGLFYVKAICKAHKWNIRIDTKTSPGSKFIIEIPSKNNSLHG